MTDSSGDQIKIKDWSGVKDHEFYIAGYQLTMPSSNVVVKVNFKNLEPEQVFPIKYETDGGEIIGTVEKEYVGGQNIILTDNVIKEGYEFAGWYESDEFNGSIVTQISKDETGDKVFYAKWTKKE